MEHGTEDVAMSQGRVCHGGIFSVPHSTRPHLDTDLFEILNLLRRVEMGQQIE